MRGLVTLATAFALPPDFPQRDLIVLTAFAVVLATLTLQGLTLAPLIRILRFERLEDPTHDLREARRALAQVGLDQVRTADADCDLTLRDLYELKCAPSPDWASGERLRRHRSLGLAVIAAQRQAIHRMRDAQNIDSDIYYQLQEEIDWRALTLLPDDERRIDEV